MKPKFFKSSSEFRKWLARHHDKEQELWVGFYKNDCAAEAKSKDPECEALASQ